MRKVIVTAAILLNLLISFSQTEVQGFPFGFYAGIKTEYFTLGGDFNGEDYFLQMMLQYSSQRLSPDLPLVSRPGLYFRKDLWISDISFQKMLTVMQTTLQDRR